MALTSFLVKFLPYLMVFQSGEPSSVPSNEENSSTSQKKPFKTKFQLMGWLFGNPLQTFDNLLPVITPSTNSKLKFGKKSVFIEQKRIFFTFSKIQKHIFCYYFENVKKSIQKKKDRILKYFFRVSDQNATSDSHLDIPLPTDQQILQHWIYLVDERRDSLRMPDDFYVSVTYDVVDNLMAFWELYSSKELRYVILFNKSSILFG